MRANEHRIYRRGENNDGGAARAFDGDFPHIAFKPKFRVPASSKMMVIGGSFARNLAVALSRKKMKPVSAECRIPGEFYRRSTLEPSNAGLSVTSPAAILDLISLGGRSDRTKAGAIQVGSGNAWSDLMMSGLRHLSAGEMTIARKRLIGTYDRLAECSVCFVTFGTTEAWFDCQDRLFLTKPAALEDATLTQQGRYRFVNLAPDEVMEILEGVVAELRARMLPDAKIILAVEPSPSAGTYTAEDCIVAERYSKAALLSAARSVAATRADVEYFPSLEINDLGRRESVWMPDGITMQRSHQNWLLGRMLDDLIAKAAE